ncbi:mechanosensitive ion channel family protein [Methanoregula sp.]|uniref:mechanosensitive ion channel family protein n=1 Tax=Methanoregula sp. TaxID=2052170 RepID=UPI0035649D9A
MAFGIADLNYIYALVTVIFGVLLALIVRFIVRWLEAKAGETDTKLDDIIIAAIGTPVQVAIIAVAVYYAISSFGILPGTLQFILDPKYVTAFYIVIGAWIISSFLHDIIAIYGHELAERSEGDWDDRLVELLELIVKWLVWFGALMAILSVFEVNITPFLAGAGIAGLAVALAAQDIISNFFGGAIITIDKPFKVGDRVRVDQYYGDVINVGPRSTRIKTLDYQIVTIPNNKITTNVIVNYSEPDEKLRITIPVSVAYGTGVDLVKKILLEITQDVIRTTDYILAEPTPKVFFVEFSDSSLKFILYVWARKYNLPDEIKDSINSRIAARFAEAGIEIPFPQMEVRLKK